MKYRGIESTMTVTPFFKQFFIAASPLLAALSVGGAASFPTVLLHQLKSNGTSIELDLNTATWLGSIHGLAGIPSIFLPTIMQWRGRKFAFIAACLVTVLGWMVAFTASSATALLVSESLHGLGTNSILAVSFLCISEMISPDYRQMYMQSYAVLQTSTMALNGILTQYIHWKTICIIMSLPMVVALLIASMWPESPYWLALRGEYQKCEEAFTWLRGSDLISKRELDMIIRTQKENNSRPQDAISLKYFWNKIKRRDFYLPSFHMFVLQYMFYWTGNYVILIYSMELIQRTTQNENASFFGGLIMNSIVCLGIATSLVLNRYYNKKSVVLVSTIAIVITMLSASVVTYLQTVGVLAKDSILCLYCLIGYMIANGIGVVPVVYNIAIEIMPVKHRGLGGALIVICSCVLHSSSLKISPYLFLYIDLWGTFLLYAVNAILCGLFLWIYVPETKGRTLQELEHYYMYGEFLKEKISGSDSKSLDTEMLPIANETCINKI